MEDRALEVGVGADKAFERKEGAQGGTAEEVALGTPHPPPTRISYWLVSFTRIQAAQPLTGGRRTFPEGTELGN